MSGEYRELDSVYRESVEGSDPYSAVEHFPGGDIKMEPFMERLEYDPLLKEVYLKTLGEFFKSAFEAYGRAREAVGPLGNEDLVGYKEL